MEEEEMGVGVEVDLIALGVGRYPTIKLGTRKVVSKRTIRGIDGRRTGMRTQ